jgi:hypothetical protein
MLCSLFKFALVLNSVLSFCELLVFDFLLSTSKALLCLMSAPQVKIVLLIDALQLLMLFVGTLTHVEPKLFSLSLFYNDT